MSKIAQGRSGGIRFDWVLLILVALIGAIGVSNLYSASLSTGSSYHLTQGMWMLIGLAVAAGIASIQPRHVQRWAWALHGVAVVLLIAVHIFGDTLNNSKRWLSFGVLSYQPSELLKVSVILVAAKWFVEHEAPDGRRLRDLLAPTLLVALPALLVLAQPDLGTAVITVLIFGTMVLFERVRLSSILIAAGVALPSLPLVWKFVLKDYQRSRITSFLDQSADIHGSGWQVRQSQIAIGSGGPQGKGWLEGTQVQNGFVPYHENDFVFALHAEQFGFIGSLALILLYLALVLWALRIARHASDRFGVLVSVGVASLLFWHVAINIGMVTGVLPVVGLWLPLMSAGGSALLTIMLCVGLLMGISFRRHNFSR